MPTFNEHLSSEGILLIDKPLGRTSFFAVHVIRKKTGQKKVGHAGTLDPFATGLLVLLLGKSWTKRAGDFLHHDKEYEAVFSLGKATDTYDCEGKTTRESPYVPSKDELEEVLRFFQGDYDQTPPMFSAKKIDGTRLYELARKGIEVERKRVRVSITTTLLSYTYPYVSLHIQGSKGTYIRSIAHDLGERLGCYAHVSSLRRVRSGPFYLEQALPLEELLSLPHEHIRDRLVRTL
jgi:tRNA pseudouridine55 synthase